MTVKLWGLGAPVSRQGHHVALFTVCPYIHKKAPSYVIDKEQIREQYSNWRTNRNEADIITTIKTYTRVTQSNTEESWQVPYIEHTAGGQGIMHVTSSVLLGAVEGFLNSV